MPARGVVYPFRPVSERLHKSRSKPPRSFWQRRVRDPIVAQLTQGITPQRVALTVAVGSSFALFPVLGTTTLLCFLVAWGLRLNQPIVQIINQLLWPLHIPAIFGCIWLGETIFGAPHVHVGIRYLKAMSEIIWHDPARFFHHFGLTVMYAIVAWAIIAPFYIAAVYYLTLPLTREFTKLKHRAEAGSSSDAPPPH